MWSFKKSVTYTKFRKARSRRRRKPGKSFLGRARKAVSRTTREYFFSRKMKKAVPVMVFQMGKVGSASIYLSLCKQYKGAVSHAHGDIDNPYYWRPHMMYVWLNNNGRLKIISPIRDPVGRNVSAFFHHVSGAGNTRDKSNLSIEELVNVFLDNPEQSGEKEMFLDHEQPLNWFDENILRYFDIDVYEKPFPESGIALYCSGNVELLVIRQDIGDKQKEQAIREFLDLPNFKLKNTNVGEQRDYSSLYSEFKKKAVLPGSYLDEMCASKYIKHFYSANEIAEVRRKWSGADLK